MKKWIFILMIVTAGCGGDTQNSYVDDGRSRLRELDSMNVINAKRQEQDNHKAAVAKMSKKAKKIYAKHPNWSIDDCVNLAENQVWIGMEYDMLVYLRGKPNTVNTSNYGNGNEYQCCWDNFNPSCFYMGDDNIIRSYN